MGWVNSVVTPGMLSRVSSIFSIISSLVLAEVHSDLSFMITMASAASMGMGSVGISALPILETISIISGNLALSICSALVVASIS